MCARKKYTVLVNTIVIYHRLWLLLRERMRLKLGVASLTLSAQPFPLPKASEVWLANGLASSVPLPFTPNGSSRNGSLANGSVGVVTACPPPPLPGDVPLPPLKGSVPNGLGPVHGYAERDNTYVHVHIIIYMYIYMYMYTCHMTQK